MKGIMKNTSHNMKDTAGSVRKTTLLAALLLSVLHIRAQDGSQGPVNLDHFRTPEASAFKKYGEESVNEYTGTADISVPLHTVKCKDIEIPIVLRYDASGIKVDQEASWVGLGWNLTVGGCINYVCAGGHDLYNSPDIPNAVWTEYLSSKFSISTYGNHEYKTQTRYYVCNPNENSNWMSSLPYTLQDFILSYTDNIGGGQGMKEYVDWGFGERDFYSVNVMGKSFMFFIDPFTLKVFTIGKAGEDFIVEPEYPSDPERGVGNQPDIYKWTITDSDGFVYTFEEGDKFQYDPQTAATYTSCWYLTKILSPTGEVAELCYSTLTRPSRRVRFESFRLPVPHGGGLACCANVSQASYSSSLQSTGSSTYVTSHYLREIRTGNQTVRFATSESNECSGRKLDAVMVLSNDSATVRTFAFSYGRFGCSTVGGNYAPADTLALSEYRLKLESVREIASRDTLTTGFSYDPTDLPSRKSCAQDFWGYYNGRENNVPGRGHSLIPAPQGFMSSHYSQALGNYSLKGADRFSRGTYMQAAVLNRVDYPTGGWTTYEYEPNTVPTNDYTLTEQYREKQYDVSVLARFTVSTSPYVVDQSEQSKDFTLTQEASLDLSLQCSGSDQLSGKELKTQIYRQSGQTYTLVESDTLTFTPNPQAPSHIRSLTLPAGNYFLLVVPISDNNNLPFTIICYLDGWYQETLSQAYYTLPCGGLRIRKISHFDHNGEGVNYTTYDYDSNGMTSGRLLDRIETIDLAHCYNMDPVGGAPGTHDVEVYTIGTGHSRLPAFFASCNPGTVGYSKVTRSRYDAAGNLEKRVVTSYRNNEPQNMYGIDYYASFDNGQTERQEIRDASDAVVARTVNTYATNMDDRYTVNMVAKYKCLNNGPSSPPATLTLVVYDPPSTTPTSTTDMGDPGTEGVADVLRYPFILSRTELSATVSTEYCPDGTAVVRTKEYQYNAANHQVSRIDESTGLTGRVRRTSITYTADGTDAVSIAMRNAHRLNDVVETRDIFVEGGQERRMGTQHTNYAAVTLNDTIYYLPVSYATSTGSGTPEIRATYSYDGMRNVRAVTADSIETVYLWSYKGQYPVAKIEGLTYAAVEAAMGAAAISHLLQAAAPGATELSSMRNAVETAGGHVTTYTYRPLVGIDSATLPNGCTVYYEYDGLGRLSRIVDHDGNVVSTNSYNYRRP